MKNKRELSIKNLCIISKVAKRKEVARARLEKTALMPAAVILAPAALSLFATLYAGYKFVLDMDYGEFINAMAAGNFDIASDNFYKLSGIKLRSWVETNDKDNFEEYNETVASAGENGSYNFRKAYLFAMDQANIEKEEKKEPTAGLGKEVAPSQSTTKQPPSTTRRAPATDLTELRKLLTEAGYTINKGEGWAPLEAPFRAAVEEFAKMGKVELIDEWSWTTVAKSVFNTTPDVSGAEKLVEALIGQQERIRGQKPKSEPAAPAPAPAPIDNKAGAKAKLTQLFDMILSGSTKVDRVGIDLRNDTKIFKGVIRGLGGVSQAVEYVFSKVPFTSEQLAELTNMSFDSNQKIAINALSPVRNLFVNIRKVSTDGIGRDRRGLTEDSLARSVTRWLGEQTATPPPAKASIRKSIEIRKMAARKKLGF